MTHNILDGIEWVWFDLDDTLYDFSTSSLMSLRKVYDEFSLCQVFPTVEDWIDCYHRHNKRLWEMYNCAEVTQGELRRRRFVLPLTEAGMDGDRAESLWQPLDSEYLKLLGQTGLLLPGAMEAVRWLRGRGLRIGILSNGFNGVQHEKICSCGLEPLVDCVVLSDEIGINKPDRRLFDYAIEKARATAESSLMIGDNPDTDIAGALRAGWRAALYSKDGDLTSIKVETCDVPVVKALGDIIKW